MDAQITNTNAQTANTLTNTARTAQQTEQAKELWSNTVATAEANLRNTSLQGDNIEQQIRASKTGQRLTEEQIQATSQSISESIERVKQLKIQGDVARADLELKNLDLRLKRLGIQPTDSPIFRIPSQVFSDPDMRGKAGRAFKNWWSK